MIPPPGPPPPGHPPPPPAPAPSPQSSGRQALEWTLEAACLQVTVEGCSIDAALVRHFGYLQAWHPFTFAALCTYLEATGNSDLLALALGVMPYE
jgi:hypothetical protein